MNWTSQEGESRAGSDAFRTGMSYEELFDPSGRGFDRLRGARQRIIGISLGAALLFGCFVIFRFRVADSLMKWNFEKIDKPAINDRSTLEANLFLCRGVRLTGTVEIYGSPVDAMGDPNYYFIEYRSLMDKRAVFLIEYKKSDLVNHAVFAHGVDSITTEVF